MTVVLQIPQTPLSLTLISRVGGWWRSVCLNFNLVSCGVIIGAGNEVIFKITRYWLGDVTIGAGFAGDIKVGNYQ